MSTQRVAPNKVVFFTYVIRDQQGQELERSDLPIGYVHGTGGRLLERLERELEGHGEGDTVEVTVPPDEGFGQHDPNLTYTDDLENVPQEFRYVGAQAEFQNDRGQVKTFTVTRIENGKLTLDGNHPFAGLTLNYRARILEVRDAEPEEIASGTPRDGSAPTVH